MRDPIANVLGSIPNAPSTLRSRADDGLLIDALLIPRVRWRPWLRAADVAPALGVAATPALLWDCASSPDVGAGTVVELASGPAADLFQGDADSLMERPGVGLSNGSDFRSFRVLEVGSATADYFAAASSVANPGSAPFAIMVVFRAGQRDGLTAGILGKRAGGVGYALQIEPDGSIVWTVSDGGASDITIAGDHGDGAWHFVVAWRNGAGFGAYSDLAAPVTGIDGGLGSLSSGEVFRLGRPDVSTPCLLAQYSTLAYFSGGDVAGLAAGRANVLAWWRASIAGGPSSATFSRAGSSSSAIDTDAEGGAVFAFAADGAPAWIRMDGPAGPHGLQTAPAFTSIIGSSDPGNSDDGGAVGGGWARDGNPTVVVRDNLGPSGFRNAVKLGKSGDLEGRLTARVALTAGTPYHFAVWCRWDGDGPGTIGVDAGPVWRIRDAADTATLQVIGTATVGRWHWHFVTFTPGATADYLVQYLASGDTFEEFGEVLIQYASGGVGAQPQPLPALAYAGGSSTGATSCSVDMPDGSGLASRSDRGTIIVDAMPLPGMPVALGTDTRILASVSDSTGENARQLGASGGVIGPKLRAEIYKATVAEVDQASADLVPATWAGCHRWALAWDLAGIPGAAGATYELERDGDGVGTSVDAFTAAPNGDFVQIGRGADVGGSWVGGIQRVRVMAVAARGASGL